jgi:hypothetical protein
MEGWRQRRLGSREPSGKRRNEEERRKREKNERNGLTLTGLLMEGVDTPRRTTSEHSFPEL